MTAACPACVAGPAVVEVATAPMAAHFSVPAIRCAACIGSIERALSQLPGVSEARVNATLRRVSVASELSAERITAALKDIGYDAYLLDAGVLERESDPVGQDLILRMGVAGFAMMNVMLLSVAVWSGATDATRDLFHLISAAIALPAVLYSARPFFSHAYQALSVRRLNMDVPISLAILLAAGMSLFETLHGGAHAYFDAALSLTFFLLIGRYLEHRTRSVARSAANELAALEVHTAQRKVAQGYETVPVSQLRVGDRVLVAAGMRVPVDGALTSVSAHTDRSFLTGESDPVSHCAGDALSAGEINLGAPFEMRATAIGSDTRLRRIAQLVETAENARNRYTSIADRAARIYAPVVHVLAAATFVGWFVATADVRTSLNVAIAVLIITCPCALGLAVPAVSTAAISKLYEMGFLVKSGTALERLADVEAFVFDKTGTLTKPAFRLHASHLGLDERRVLKGLAQVSSHPLSKALAARLTDLKPANLTHIREHAGLGVTATWRTLEVALGRAAWLGHSGSALMLQVGAKHIDLTYREEALDGAETLSLALGNCGLTTEIISGDTEAKTRDVARQLSIPRWTACSSPENKARHVADLNAETRVCMVGDGINDTAALSNAHVSVAPGTALDATRNAADIIMIGNALGRLPALVRISRRAIQLSRQNFGIAILYNAVAIPIAIAGFATPLMAALAMSCSSITVLLNAMRVRSGT